MAPAVDLRARLRSPREPLPATGTSLASPQPGYEAAVECDRLIRAVASARFDEPFLAARHYADRYRHGFPLVDRLIDAVVQAPLTSPLTGLPTMQLAARRMLTWLGVEPQSCPDVAWTENGKYHVVDPDRRTHTLCKRQIIERPYYKTDLTPWSVGVQRGVWQIVLAQGDACTYCVRNEKTASIASLAETTEFDVLDAFSVEFHTGAATDRAVAELVSVKDELMGGSAVASIVWKAVRETVFFGLTETAVTRALKRMVDNQAWLGHHWVMPETPHYNKRELLWQIEAWTPDPNKMSEAIRAAGHEQLFREGPDIPSERELERAWRQEVGLQLVRRCWPSFAWE